MITEITYTGDGVTTDFTITFENSGTDVQVDVNEELVASSLITDTVVRVTPAPAAGATVRVYRNTDITARAVDFSDGAVLTESDLDASNVQVFRKVQELESNLSAFKSRAVAAAAPGDTLRIPSAGERANKFLSFDAASAMATLTAEEAAALVDPFIPKMAGPDGPIAQAAIVDLVSDLSDRPTAAQLLLGTGSEGIGFLQSGTGAVAGTVADKLLAFKSVKDFGAVGDGVTDDTAAVTAALAAVIADRTNPLSNFGTTLSTYGQNVLYFPKGRYKLTDTIMAAGSLIGLKIVGDGKAASTIEFYSDSAHLISAGIHINFSIEDIAIHHIEQDPDYTTWTCRMLDLLGTGGGRQLTLRNVSTRGWDRIVHYEAVVNNDGLQMHRCDMQYFNTVVYARSGQALINDFNTCHFYGQGDVCNISGFGQTLFTSCDIVIDGSTLRFVGAPSLFGNTSVYTFINTKWEPENEHGYAGGSRSAICTVEGASSSADIAYINAKIVLINSGFEGGPALDPLYPQLEVTSNMSVEWIGGQFKSTAKIRLVPQVLLGYAQNHHKSVAFRRMQAVPKPTNILRLAATGSQTYNPVVYDQCVGMENLCVGHDAGTGLSAPASLDEARQVNSVGSSNNQYPVLTFGAAKINEIEFHGAPQIIDDVEVSVSYKTSPELVLELSTDDFATIEQTLYIPSGTATKPARVRASDPYKGSKTYDWPNLVTATTQSTTVTVRGAKVGDPVEVAHSAPLGGTRIWGEVTAADTVTVYQRNETGGDVDVSSGTLTAWVRPRSTIIGKATTNGFQVRASGPLAYGYALVTHTAR